MSTIVSYLPLDFDVSKLVMQKPRYVGNNCSVGNITTDAKDPAAFQAGPLWTPTGVTRSTKYDNTKPQMLVTLNGCPSNGSPAVIEPDDGPLGVTKEVYSLHRDMALWARKQVLNFDFKAWGFPTGGDTMYKSREEQLAACDFVDVTTNSNGYSPSINFRFSESAEGKLSVKTRDILGHTRDPLEYLFTAFTKRVNIHVGFVIDGYMYNSSKNRFSFTERIVTIMLLPPILKPTPPREYADEVSEDVKAMYADMGLDFKALTDGDADAAVALDTLCAAVDTKESASGFHPAGGAGGSSGGSLMKKRAGVATVGPAGKRRKT